VQGFVSALDSPSGWGNIGC